MSVTIGTKNGSIRNNLKAQYIAAACGVALAVTAVVGLGGQRDGSVRPTSAPNAASIPAGPSTSDRYIFYLVGSEAERDALIESAKGDDFITPTTSIVIVKSQADEFSIRASQAELTSVDHSVGVIDLRQPLPAPPAQGSSPLSAAQVEDSGMASVVSAELANFGSGVAVTAPSREMVERYAMASVISTERAAWVFSDEAR